jgi:hypothetical protein
VQSAAYDKIPHEDLRAGSVRLGLVVTGSGELETWGLPPGWIAPSRPPTPERILGQRHASDPILQMLEQALRTYLTSSATFAWLAAPPWCVSLGLPWPHTAEQARDAFRRLAKTAHPDRGGDPAEFIRIESAYRAAMAYFERSNPR